MTDRRKFLTGLPIAAVAIAAGAEAAENPPVSKAVVTPPAPKPWEQPVLCQPVTSGNLIDSAESDSFPNVALTNQNGLTVPFYQTFIRDRVVMLNFMSIRDEEHLPATAMMSMSTRSPAIPGTTLPSGWLHSPRGSMRPRAGIF